MKLHQKIKTLRKKMKMSQQELADKIGMHISHLSRIENGHFQPSLDVLRKLTGIFGASYDYLLDDDLETYEKKIKDKSLAEKMHLVDALDEEDRKALIQVIECMLTKKKIRDLLMEKESFKI